MKHNMTIDEYLERYSEGKMNFEDFKFLTGLSSGEANARIQNYLQEKSRQNQPKPKSKPSSRNKKKETYTILNKNTIYRYIEIDNDLYAYNFKGEIIGKSMENNSSNKMLLEMEMYKQAKELLEQYKKQIINAKDRELLAKWATLINVRDSIDGENLSKLTDEFSFNVANSQIDILEYQEYIKQVSKTHLGRMVYRKK